MLAYGAGERIRSSRLRYGMTQEELAYGVCSTSTLSKIEHGIQCPNMQMYEALLHKLGETLNYNEITTSKNEIQNLKIYKQFVYCILQDDMEKANNLIHTFEVMLWQNRSSNEQLFLYMLCVWKSKNEKDPFLVAEQLEAALRLSMPTYTGSLPDISRRITFHEINILNVLAIQYLKMGKTTTTLTYLKWMKEYFEKYDVAENQKARIYPMILCNYADILTANGFFEQSLKIAEIGKKICMKYENLIMLPFLISSAARNFMKIGKSKCADEYFTYASNLFRLMEFKNSLQHITELNGAERALHVIL